MGTIFLVICRYMHSFSMVHSCARLRITLTARRMAHFTRVGAALSIAVDSSIAHIPWKKSKPIKEKAGTGEKCQMK